MDGICDGIFSIILCWLIESTQARSTENQLHTEVDVLQSSLTAAHVDAKRWREEAQHLQVLKAF